MFAGNPTTLNLPLIIATTGAVTSCATNAIAINSASPDGTPHPRNRSRTGADHSTRPAVAITDSANPGSAASSGHHNTPRTTADPSAGNACARRDLINANNPIRPIIAARNTLGDGRTRMTKHTTTTAPTTAVNRGDAPSIRTASTAAPQTMAKLLPDTVVLRSYYPGMRAIIYCRVSSDPHQRGKSVEDQEEECRAIAKANGWTVGDVLVDNDRGASRYSSKDRPAYRQLARILAPGDVLVTWEASRAQRDLKAYIQLRDLCAERGVMWSYSGRTYDLARGDDRFTTGLDALLAEKEVEQSRERVLRSVRANAAAGRPHGKLAYGYKIVRDPDTGQPIDRIPNPDTAPLVQEAARRVLAGEAIYSVCADFNERGIPGPRPKKDGSKAPWIPVTMRKILESPTYAALRVHKGDVVGDATWEPIITREDHQRLLALFSDPTRLTHRGSEPKWLLTGVARCGVCGGQITRQKNRGFDAYLCKSAFHVSRNIKPVDEYVTETVIRRLESQTFMGDLADADVELRAAIDHARGLQERLDSFTDSAAEGELSPAALTRIEAKLRPQITAAESRVRSLMPSPRVAEMAGPGARQRWLELTIKDRRELLAQIVEVRIHPVGRGRYHALTDGLELIWR